MSWVLIQFSVVFTQCVLTMQYTIVSIASFFNAKKIAPKPGQMPGNRIIGNELFGKTPKEVPKEDQEENCLLVLVIGWNKCKCDVRDLIFFMRV